ncbi:hypothetical protein SCATT_48720 [Streptantibioticus cattleyicolor NRRL 8057 = DSM 46488]|uniref:Uncharacterized protein n=1 Tax=Streptantibioticus cattleyicolor (strain ATCC 35852 / DSM 46488 / JCM 4925 / NBRC 14057 / NRRL 8057) TaxID=1003195 RepID=G8WXU3_STREN|nr:hypothetical protein SCATT_48720 [Streptantibioticus cattleyicolor NRRL 8057 = DSM 46488]
MPSRREAPPAGGASRRVRFRAIAPRRRVIPSRRASRGVPGRAGRPVSPCPGGKCRRGSGRSAVRRWGVIVLCRRAVSSRRGSLPGGWALRGSSVIPRHPASAREPRRAGVPPRSVPRDRVRAAGADGKPRPTAGAFRRPSSRRAPRRPAPPRPGAPPDHRAFRRPPPGSPAGPHRVTPPGIRSPLTGRGRCAEC